MKRRILFLSVLLAVAVTSILVWHIAIREHDPVNVVLIGIDTLRADHMGCYGYEKNTTPRLDEAARNGVLFQSCTSQAPWTLPSFASVFTSLYPSQHGAQINKELRNLSEDVPRKLKNATTLTMLLKSKGFKALACASNPFTGHGIDAGFDSFLYNGDGAHEVTDVGIKLLEGVGKQPFFLYLHYNDVHEHHTTVPRPYTQQFTSAETLTKMGRRTVFSYEVIRDLGLGTDLYDAQVGFCDSQIGRFFDALKKKNLWRKTLVVILSDHGEEFWEHEKEEAALAADPRAFYGVGHGQSLYREMMDVPLIFTGGGAPKGRVVSGAVRLIDVMPTILDYLHIKTDTPMEGISLKPAILSGYVKDLPVYSEGIAYGYEKKSLRINNWKYIFSFYGQAEELFDLDKDPLEKHNLIETEKKQARYMREQITPFIEKGREDEFGQEGQEQIEEDVRKRLQGLGYLN